MFVNYYSYKNQLIFYRHLYTIPYLIGEIAIPRSMYNNVEQDLINNGKSGNHDL